MNLDSIIRVLEKHKADGGPTANVLAACLIKRKDIWSTWDPAEAVTTIFLYLHDDTEPDTVTQKQHDAIEEIAKLAGAVALRILATVIRSNIGKD